MRNANQPLALVVAFYHSAFGFNTQFAGGFFNKVITGAPDCTLLLRPVASPFPPKLTNR